MAAFKDLITVANDSAFQNRVLYALEVAAVAVMSESSSTQGHAQRVTFANKIIQDGAALTTLARGVLTNSTVASETDISKNTNGDYGIPDGDIQFVVNTLFSAFAGVSS